MGLGSLELFPGARLPADAKRALGLGVNAHRGWDPGDEASRRRALAGYELVEPRVRSTETRAREGSAEVAAIATAEVALAG